MSEGHGDTEHRTKDPIGYIGFDGDHVTKRAAFVTEPLGRIGYVTES